MTAEIIEFIRARLDEDAGLVETIREGRCPTPTWVSEPNERGSWPILREIDDSTPIGYIADGRWEVQHVVRHDPARVLRGVEAKRQLVDMHAPDGLVDLVSLYSWCTHCGRPLNVNEPCADLDPWPCRHIRLVASEWSDHPDYRAEWKP